MNFVLMVCRSLQGGERTVLLCLNHMTMEEAKQAISWQNLYPNPAIKFVICRKMNRTGAFYEVARSEIIHEPEQGFYTAAAWRDFLLRYWPLPR